MAILDFYCQSSYIGRWSSRSTPWYRHLVAKNGNFTFLLLELILTDQLEDLPPQYQVTDRPRRGVLRERPFTREGNYLVVVSKYSSMQLNDGLRKKLGNNMSVCLKTALAVFTTTPPEEFHFGMDLLFETTPNGGFHFLNYRQGGFHFWNHFWGRYTF